MTETTAVHIFWSVSVFHLICFFHSSIFGHTFSVTICCHVKHFYHLRLHLSFYELFLLKKPHKIHPLFSPISFPLSHFPPFPSFPLSPHTHPLSCRSSGSALWGSEWAAGSPQLGEESRGDGILWWKENTHWEKYFSSLPHLTLCHSPKPTSTPRCHTYMDLVHLNRHKHRQTRAWLRIHTLNKHTTQCCDKSHLMLQYMS